MRHKKSLLTMVRKGYWWGGKKRGWMKDLKAPCCSNRNFKTLKALEKAINSTPAPFSASAYYYKTNKHGQKGWVERYIYELKEK